MQVLLRPENGLKPVVDVDFMKDVVKMGFDGMGADAHLVGDRVIRCANRKHPQQFDLAF